MLVGAFDLIQTKRDQYDAWQGYFESVRDYWITRSALRAATGGFLPGDTVALPPAAGPEDIVPTAQQSEHHGDHHR
jgi:cobalt-zinc-cadmium efflux system outer membrane protein